MWNVAVISNQYKQDETQVRAKFQTIFRLLGDGLSYFYATEKDQYRKPSTGMYKLLLGDSDSHPESFYCGDAAGRKGDFSICDYYFALNCGLKFIPAPLSDIVRPTVCLYHKAGLDLSKYIAPAHPKLGPSPSSSLGPYMIMMVGPQGSGKSYTSARIKSAHPELDLLIINRDTMGSAKVKSEFSRAMTAGRSVILDNTNPTAEGRQEFLLGVPGHYRKICYYFDIPKTLSTHLCLMRAELGGPYIPAVARHTYYKRLVPPSIAEGLDEVHVVTGLDIAIPEYRYHYNLDERS
jgi:bifunctional polynucleotide phosphatase/kinase